MKEVGTFEAKTHLSALLDEVARGAEVTITRRGVAVARLVPAEAAPRSPAGDPIARAKAFAKHQSLGRLSWKALRDEGRR
ncbi:MAG TPA: type II toxin-antitoxin system prevent-host-death family antitoxin [Burkholderiaceae bacterium]|nr:type II toxin-antitoxin system prevent-host-death family antitoxin [Burkholderiaceae bacterium]